MDAMDMFNSTLDDPLESVLSLSPPPDSNEFDDPALFQELTDFIDDEGTGNNSPIYDHLSSDSEHSIIDVDNQDDISLDVVNNSEGDEELVRYLTENGNRPQSETESNTNGIYVCKPNSVNTRKQLVQSVNNDLYNKGNGLSRLRYLAQRPIVVSGKHSVVRIPKHSTIGLSNLYSSVQIVKNDQTEGGPHRPSSPSESVTSSRGNCLSKSALAARENREKKKKYIAQLETNVHDFGKENKSLKHQVKELDNEVEELRNEVAYLKSVLVNQSTLSKLLQNIPGVTGVRLMSSENKIDLLKNEFMEKNNNDSNCEKSNTSDVSISSNRKRPRVDDHDYATSKTNTLFGESISGSSKKKFKVVGVVESKGPKGVCLHVADGDVSLEFCALCSEKASKAKGYQ